MSWNNFNIPGCKINPDSDTITCDARKIFQGKTIAGEGPIVWQLSTGQLIDDGKTPEQIVKETKLYIKKVMKIRNI